MSDVCLSLESSTTCSAFSKASISTGPNLFGQFPFLQYVSNIAEFDERLQSYVRSDHAKQKYQVELGCSDLDLKNTTYLYARYSTSVICNGIVQSSKVECSLTEEQSRPLCAETCALAATSEEMITVNEDLCGTPRANFMDQIRSDFTICSIPANSLSGKCIHGHENEPSECGYGPNLLGLCGFCAESSPNSTDSCCVTSDSTNRCANVVLPTITSFPPLFPTTTTTTTASATSTEGAGKSGLTGGQIAGVAVGSVGGFVLLGALAVLLFLWVRRRRQQEDNGSIFNRPAPPRRPMSAVAFPPPGSRGSPATYNVTPGGRVARMSALQGSHDGNSNPAPGTGKYDSSDSDAFGESPAAGMSKRGPPVTGRRNGSLSSTSVLAGDGDTTSPKSGSGGQFSSPEGVASAQSEQLPYFKDYYSQDDIHPNDKVSVLWAYQPRAGDEFELERGDMLKMVGIWDDGWATGVRIPERAEDYEENRNAQRDSGVSNGSSRRASSPPPAGEIKAFPLVCVCLPEHWRKTIEGYVDSSGSDEPPV
ncbi:hypothetical protein FQN57_002052 [Myotisia sp. PD_48]|nr:hypothetical protein FQN57_002052 [Myotisia sp. PD_48]